MEKFVVNEPKTVTALLYVAGKVPGIRFHRLLKIIYFADLKHIAKYGRPITGDKYVAMESGPVASWLYDLLKKNVGQEYWGLFDVDSSVTIKPKREPNLDLFSKSDIECLDESLSENKGLGFGRLKAKSHDSAWKDTWDKVGANKEIKIEKLVAASGASKEMIEYLEKRDEY